MKVGIRGKLFGLSVGLIVCLGVVSTVVLSRETSAWYRARLDDQLTATAHTARLLLEHGNMPLAQVVRELETESGARVTIIDANGDVVTTSRVRPNVDLVEVSEPVTFADGEGTVRIAMPESAVEGGLGRLRGLIVFATLGSIAIAALMSAFASHLMSGALQSLVDNTRGVLAGPTGRRLTVQGPDELGGIAGSFNQIVGELEGTVAVLAQERNRFEATLESMSEAVFALDADERITLVNTAALDMLRLASPPMGRTLVEVVRAPALIELASTARGAASRGIEFELRGPKPRRLMARATPLKNTGGLVIVLHDVTDLRRLETIRSDFVANVSHELRTPVSIIRANVETLLDGAMDDPKQARRFLEALSRSAERLSQLVADLLDISRIEAGAYKLEMTAVPVLAAMQRAVDSVTIASQHKSLTVTAEGDPEMTALADTRALDQVLMNLVDNAVKYTQQGGSIVVRAKPIEEGIRIEVCDDGPGIEPRHRARIFERFYRVDEGRSRAMGGTGLGLAIVKHLMEAMRGQVGVDGGSPRGSVFWVELHPGTEALPPAPEPPSARASA